MLQHRIEQVEYDMIRHDFETVDQFYPVGACQVGISERALVNCEKD